MSSSFFLFSYRSRLPYSSCSVTGMQNRSMMQKKTKQTYWRKKERRSKKIWRNGRGVTICSDHRVLDVIDVNDEKNSNTHSLPTIPLNNETRQMIQEKVVAEYETITGRTWYKASQRSSRNKYVEASAHLHCDARRHAHYAAMRVCMGAKGHQIVAL